MDFGLFLNLLLALDRHGVDYALVGGTALGLHGLVQATEAVDLFVKPEAGNVGRLKQALRSVWDDSAIEQIAVEDLAGEYPTVRYVPPEGGLAVDVLSRLGTAFRFEDIEAQTPTLERCTREGGDSTNALPDEEGHDPPHRPGGCGGAQREVRAGGLAMPVYRYRDFDEARRALWTTSAAPDLSVRLRSLWAFAARLCPRRPPPSVRKFRTLEEAAHDRTAWPGPSHPAR